MYSFGWFVKYNREESDRDYTQIYFRDGGLCDYGGKKYLNINEIHKINDIYNIIIKLLIHLLYIVSCYRIGFWYLLMYSNCAHLSMFVLLLSQVKEESNEKHLCITTKAFQIYLNLG